MFAPLLCIVLLSLLSLAASLSALTSHASVTPLGTLTSSLYHHPSVPPPSVEELTDTGMSAAFLEHLKNMHGPNSLPAPPGKSLLSRIAAEFSDTLVQILLGVASLSAGFSFLELRDGTHTGSPLAVFLEPIVILLILVLNAIVGIYMSLSAESSLSSLTKLNPSLTTVIRAGVTIPDFPTAQLIPGDVVLLKTGDKIPADLRILTISGPRLGTDEAALTGEPETVDKDTSTVSVANPKIQEQVNMLFSGTCLTVGGCRGVVTCTGSNTELGKIQSSVTIAAAEAPPTPLQQKLDVFASKLTKIVAGICLMCFVAAIPKFQDPVFDGKVWKGALYYAKVAVALGVAAIPEGLPAVITLCLSLGTGRMARRNVIVRRLPSVETLGCTSVICTDKTGTLTSNMMTVTEIASLTEEGAVRTDTVEGIGYDPRGCITGVTRGEYTARDSPLFDVAHVAAVCNDAVLTVVDGVVTRVGEPTEAALVTVMEKMCAEPPTGSPLEVVAGYNKKIFDEKYRRVACLEFNRDRKSMGVICEDNESKVRTLLVKGAPKNVLSRCSHVKLPSGEIVAMSDEIRERLLATTDEMARRPLRTLACAVKTDLGSDILEYQGGVNDVKGHPTLGESSMYSEVESGMVFVGLVGIKDPARPEVADAIDVCTKAGIRVMMITGDAKETAVAIAKDVRIFTEKDVAEGKVKAFEGREFFEKKKEEQLEILKEGNVVFCRTEPADKQRLVKMLQSLGEIPAMTGDGVNDAPALQQAAIGIAMGITGTEVAKEAADMILVDDNFATIVAAVEEGRCIYNSMQAFICFLISCNIGEIFCIFFASILGMPEPLTAIHLLWVNLVTDGPPATALGFNPPDPDVMLSSPRRGDEEIMTGWLLMRYMLTGLYVGLATVGVTVWHYMSEAGVSWTSLRRWGSCEECGDIFSAQNRIVPQTLALTTLVAMEMLKALSAVSVDNSLFVVPSWRNKWLLLGVAVPSLLHLGVMNSKGLGKTFGMVALTKAQWIKVAQFSFPILALDEGLKTVGRWVNRQEEEKRKLRKKAGVKGEGDTSYKLV